MTLRIYTHPACAGCSPAVKMGWDLTESYSDLNLETVKLESKAGLAKAQTAGIKTIPTLIFILGDAELKRIIGLPEAQLLEQTFLELRALKN